MLQNDVFQHFHEAWKFAKYFKLSNAYPPFSRVTLDSADAIPKKKTVLNRIFQWNVCFRA